MAKSKKSKILAMALCASVMTGIYASPVMAAELYEYNDVNQWVTTKGASGTKITELEGLEKITLGDSVKITTDGKGIIRVGDVNGVNTRVHNDGFYINKTGNDGKTSLTAGTLTLAGNELTSAQLARIKRVVGKVDNVEGKIGGIRRAGTTDENRSTYIEKTVRVNNNSGLVVYAEDDTTFAAQIDREGNVLTEGVGRFGALEGSNVRMENGVLTINSNARNAVAKLDADGLMLTDDNGAQRTLTAAKIADIKGITRDPVAETTTIEGATSFTKDGMKTSSFTAGVTEDSIYHINAKGEMLFISGDNSIGMNRNGIGFRSGTENVTINGDGTTFTSGSGDSATSTVIKGGTVTASNDFVTTNADGSTKYTLNTVGADLDALETNVGNISGNVAGIKRNAGAAYGEGRTVIEGVVGVNGKDGRFYVLGEDGRTQAAVITNDGTARFGDYNNANVRMENGVLSINEGTNAVASLSKDGLILSDSENVKHTLTAAKIADIQHIEHVGNATVIEGETSFTTNGMKTNRITATSGNIGGVEIAGGLVDGVNMDDLGGIKRTGTGEPGTQTTTIEGVTSFNSDGMTTTTVTTSEIGVGGSGFYANSTGITVGNGRFSVDSGTGNLAISNGTVPVFQVNGKTGQVNIGANGGSQTVITGNSITTETLNVEKIVLGDKIVDKETGDVIGELEIGADGSIKIANNFEVDTDNLAAHYGETSLNMDSDGFNLNYGTGENAPSLVLDADGFAFAGPVHLGNGTQVEFSHNGTDISLSSLVGRVEDLELKTTGISFDESNGSTTIKDMDKGTDGKWTAGDSSVTVGNNGTTFEGAGNGTTNIDGSKITSDADGTISGGSGSSTNSIDQPFGSSTSNGEETVYNGENGNINTVNSSGMTVTTNSENGNTNTNTVNSSGMTVTNGTSTTVIDAEKVDTTTGNFSKEVTVGIQDNQTVITGGDISVDNSVTVAGGSENKTTINNEGITVGDKGTSIKNDSISVGDGGYIGDGDVRSGEGVSLNQTAERVGHLENRVGKLEDRVDKVGAMAAAIANLRTMGYDPAAPTEVAVGIGQYRDETGAALGLFHYPNRDFMLSLSVSTSGDEVMGGIGATWKFGRKSPEKVAEIKKAQAEADARRAEEAKLAKAEEMKQAAKEAKIKAQQERHAKLAAQAEAAK